MKFIISEDGVLSKVKLEDNETNNVDVIIPDEVKVITAKVFCLPFFPNVIRSVIFPEGLTTISSHAFCGQTHLDKIVFPSTIREIGEKAFRKIGQAAIDITADELNITDFVFSESSITSLKITANKLTLGHGAFSNCQYLKKVDLSENNKDCNTGMVIPDMCFDTNLKLESVSLPKIKSIGMRAFYGTEIKNISLKTNGEPCQIMPSAFAQCMFLEKVILENDNYIIRSGAFEGCENLKEIDTTKINVIASNAFKKAFDKYSRIKLLFKDGAEIEELAFCSSNVYEIDLSNVGSVGASAFYNCSYLENIILPTTPDYDAIASGTFEGTINLKQITLHNNIRIIGASAFEGSGIEGISFPTSLQYIAVKAFYGSFLSKIDLSKAQQLEAIGYSAFSSINCKKIDLSYNFMINKNDTKHSFDPNTEVVYSVYSE